MDTEHLDFVEQENARLAARAIAAEARAERATRDVAALEMQLEGQAAASVALAQRLEQLEDLHTPTLSEHYAVTSLVRLAQRLGVQDLEVHVFIGGRRLI